MQRNVVKILALATIALGISHVEPHPRSIEATGGAAPLAQTTANLGPLKDNTLHEDAAGSKSNGSGAYFFTGRTGQASGSIRRGLIAFDVAGSIPAGSTINSVSLTLQLNKGNGGSQTITLHTVDSDWGEGASSSSGGQGAAAQTNDATWLHRFSTTSQWSTAGGDFQPTSSASTPVGGTTVPTVQPYTWSSTQMASDVQGWLDNPSTNFGWLLKGNEGAIRTAKKFHSRESSTAANRPTLSVQYTPPTFSIADATVGEGAGVATLTVTVDPTIGTPVSVDVATSDGTAVSGSGQEKGGGGGGGPPKKGKALAESGEGVVKVEAGMPILAATICRTPQRPKGFYDYTATSTTVTIQANGTSTQVTITIADDSLDEPDETFHVTLSNPSAGTLVSPSASTSTVTIIDDDQPSILICAQSAVSGVEGNAGSTSTVDVLVELSATSSSPVSVDYAASDGTATVAGGDYATASGTLAIPAGNTTGTLQVIVNGDVIDEFDETFVITLSGATTTGAGLTISPATTTVTIVDDDPAPALAIPDQTVNEADGTATVTVTLMGASGGGVEVDVATSGGTAAEGVDYFPTSTRLVWAPDEGGDKAVIVPLIDDDKVEGAEFVLLRLSNAGTTGPSAEGVVVGDDSALLKIIDDEAPQLTAIPAITQWGLLALSGLLGAAILGLRRMSPGAGRTGRRRPA